VVIDLKKEVLEAVLNGDMDKLYWLSNENQPRFWSKLSIRQIGKRAIDKLLIMSKQYVPIVEGRAFELMLYKHVVKELEIESTEKRELSSADNNSSS
jgi:hypothetical protein